VSEPVVWVENLGKRYRIRPRQRYATLRENLTAAPARLFAQLRGRNHSDSAFWALKGVSFTVDRGEVLGIVGRNGAGKTTLLRLLSRITRPTEGEAEVRGRVGSLLEVGTGFHPELSGRENVYLSGAVLGMKRREINAKFDEIVAFSGVEQFLETPLKRYSVGMQMRLAFAVAAHLEPEILLVDEVLAVGDLEFQKKCLGKMGEVARGGRTVLLVSHQLNQIRRLCQRVIWLDGGQTRELGPAHQVVSAYEAAMTSGQVSQQERPGVKARFVRWELGGKDADRQVLQSHGPLTVRFLLEVYSRIRDGHHGVSLFNAEGQLMWGTAQYRLELEAGEYVFSYELPGLPLRPGLYPWQVSLYDDEGLIDLWNCVPEMAIETQPVTHPQDVWAGILNVPCEFSVYRDEH
jgi:homopolymeric O-antigen transport system ATP-binding protein